MSEFVVSVDLGGTKILSAIVDKENKILDRVKTATSIKNGGEGIVKSIVASIDTLVENNRLDKKSIKGVCLGVPGIINPFEGIIYKAPNLGLENYNIKEVFHKYNSLPVYLENDVNLGALGIKRKEYNNDVKNMFVIFIGTGIGSAIILDGRLYRGSTFFAGEVGHMVLNSRKDRDERNNVTFENYASRTAIVKKITRDIKDGKKSILKEFVEDDKRIKSKALANAFKKGDKVVIEHVTGACEVIGNVIGNIHTLMNFDTIVLGGGVIEALGKEMQQKIENAFHNSAYESTGQHVKFVTTSIGDDAPLYGGWEVVSEGYELNIK